MRPTFDEPWQAQAFALTVQLSRDGKFTWDEWSAALAAQIAAAGPENGEPDYESWLTALESLISAKGLAGGGELASRKSAWADAYRVTAHGGPVRLPGSEDLRLLAIDAATTFVINGSGRIERENDPDRTSGPRLFFAGCSGGNLIRLRHDVSDRIASRTLALADIEPAWSDLNSAPRCLEALKALLSGEAPVESVSAADIFGLPHGLNHDAAATIVVAGSAQGDGLLADFRARGVPRSLLEAGFADAGHLWAPWCIALEGDDIASIAFAARIGPAGAEVGVYTFPGFRGRGLAASVTAAWSSLPALENRALFYSTLRSNLSSQRVVVRLGLRRIGASVRIV